MNEYGQLGNGNTGADRNVPVAVQNLTDLKSVKAGSNHGLALKKDGTVWAWGDNSSGQLGDGTNGDDRTTPVDAAGRFVADLEALRAHFGHDRWLVGGHSWGVTLALRYAFAHPERVAALLYLCGTGVGSAWRRAHHAEADRRLTTEQRRRRDELKVRERNGAEEREFRTLNGAPDFAGRGRALELAAAQYAADPFPSNYGCNAALNTETKAWEGPERLAECRALAVPVLVLGGDGDPRPTWALDGMVEALPRAELCVLPGVGHMPWAEDPAGFNSVITSFLRKVA